MIIEVNNQKVELRFGLKFLKNINDQFEKEAKKEFNGVNIGLQIIYGSLMIFDPFTLVKVIKAANYGDNSPKLKDLEIEEYIENNDVEELCKDFLHQLETQSVTKGQARLVKESIEEEMKKATI
ncbi:tail assembly chaperone [Helcococcus bovis]|uniref:tail assembly chaperone n=1 Tax=Helcococcus bovis TaxID=3153252 RepID=UPI0038B89AC3